MFASSILMILQRICCSMTFLTDTGMPVTSSEVRENMKITVIYTDKCHLRLGSGLRDKELYIVAEQAVGKEIISYL